jgi:hypothetical protein
VRVIVESSPEARAALVEAVEEALRTRGTVMLEDAGAQESWCAVCAAVDGALELRVGEPAGRRRERRDRERWLRDRGFHRVPDAWSLPVRAGAGVEECVATLAEVLGGDPVAPLRRVLEHPGIASGDLPPPGAPPAEHLSAALRALAVKGRGRVDVSGGRPARLWAIVWAFPDDHELLVEPERGLEDTWREPLSLDGAAAAARKLGDCVELQDGPMFLEYLAP